MSRPITREAVTGRRRRLVSALALTLSVLSLGTGVAEAATPIEASSVATGRGHSCAILSSGQVVCWGNNFYGELGNGTNTPSKSPVAVSGLSDAESISANGEYTTCAVRIGGQVLCWGKNTGGQIGDGSKADRSVPTPVTGLTDAKSISVGPFHACAIRTSGQAVCWGQNDHGQLGDTSTTEHLTPVNVNGLTDARSIAVGWTHTCAAREGGAALCWGYPVNGVLGIGPGFVDVKTPTAVKGVGGAGTLGGIAQMAVGSTHSCALGESGQVYCWGDNYFGRLGDDTILNKDVPVEVHDMADAKFISAGYASSCAIRKSGQALCWGANAQGRLGDGTDAERHTPTAVSGVGDAKQMSGKLSHMCAVRVSGQTVCWGDNTSGQLGDGTETSSFTPVVVGGSPLVLRGRPILQNGVTTLVVFVPSAGRLTVQQANGGGNRGGGKKSSASLSVASADISAAKGKKGKRGKGRKGKRKGKRRRPSLIRKVVKRPKRAGPVRVKIKPTKFGRKALNKRRKFTVKVRISFTPAGTKQTQSVTRKVTVKKKGKGKGKARARARAGASRSRDEGYRITAGGGGCAGRRPASPGRRRCGHGRRAAGAQCQRQQQLSVLHHLWLGAILHDFRKRLGRRVDVADSARQLEDHQRAGAHGSECGADGLQRGSCAAFAGRVAPGRCNLLHGFLRERGFYACARHDQRNCGESACGQHRRRHRRRAG